ncbi:MAG TPA: sulfotransferase [Caulobacteraceae bacterium]|jgi:tetratricopeptide (TPR) repeat protein
MSQTQAPARAVPDAERLGEIESLIRTNQVPRAAELAEQALAEGLEHPMLLNLSAYGLEQQGRFDEALSRLIRARELAPLDPSVLNALGLAYAGAQEHEAAAEAFAAAVAAYPRFAPAWYNKGAAEETLGRLDHARASYEQGVALQPDHVGSLAGLASVAARKAEYDQARQYAERALAIAPGLPVPVMALTNADMAAGDYAGAEARLRELLADPRVGPAERAIAEGLLGDVLDAQNRTAEAFAAYTSANGGLQKLHAPRMAGRQSVLEAALWLIRYFEKAPVWPPRRNAPASPPDIGGHVFLVGFPRSGTTLLEQVLASHPSVVALEERETLADAARLYMKNPAGLDRLTLAGEGELQRLRDAYWARVREAGVEPGGRVFVDKLPLNTVKLPLIAWLFPRAKVLFARRDPRDVVLSGFRRRFRINPSMYQLLTLNGAAQFYDAVMRLAELYRARLPLDLKVVRHEDLVDDFEAQARAICRFIGLPWDPALHGFAERVRDRSVATPSAQQVAKGLNRDGMGQWRRYKAELGPVLPLLQPWVERFGYPAD